MSYFLKHLIYMNKAGWQCDNLSGYKETAMPLASFYMYYPATGTVIYASMPMDDLMDLIGRQMAKLPLHLLKGEVLAREVAICGNNYHDIDFRKVLPGMLALYMAHTITGRRYFEQAAGRPFHFSVIMYPADKKGKDSLVRPFLTMDNNPVLSVDELKARCESVIDIDRQANKPYFAFLKANRQLSKAV